MLMESPLGHVAGWGTGRAYSGRTCCRLGFLDEASDIWLSWSAASSAAPSLHLFFVPQTQLYRAVSLGSKATSPASQHS